LLLALTEEFGGPLRTGYQEAEKVVDRLDGRYEKTYYRGIVYERWARSKLREGTPVHVAGEWLQRAMEQYREAESLRSEGDDSAILRWNSCARLAKKVPKLLAESSVHELHLGD
jgi:HEPN domain-containing protein